MNAQMEHILFSVDDSTGNTKFLVNELSRSFLDDFSVIQRASHVEPVNGILRIVFFALRAMFGEYGSMAQFTRLWPCLWRVNLSPVAGPILPTVHRDRAQAIDAEISWLESNFL